MLVGKNIRTFVEGETYKKDSLIYYVHTSGSSSPVSKGYILRPRADLTSVQSLSSSSLNMFDYDVVTNSFWSFPESVMAENDYDIFPGDIIHLEDTGETLSTPYKNVQPFSLIRGEWSPKWRTLAHRRSSIYMESGKTVYYQINKYNDYNAATRDRSGTRRSNPETRINIKAVPASGTAWIRINFIDNFQDAHTATYPEHHITATVWFMRGTWDNMGKTVSPFTAFDATVSDRYVYNHTNIAAGDFLYYKISTYLDDGNLYIRQYTVNEIPESLQ